jgi:hypothetical protein
MMNKKTHQTGNGRPRWVSRGPGSDALAGSAAGPRETSAFRLGWGEAPVNTISGRRRRSTRSILPQFEDLLFGLFPHPAHQFVSPFAGMVSRQVRKSSVMI